MTDIAVAGTMLESTARWTAAVRAAETAREDRLFEDPWAEALAGEEGRAWIAARTPESVAPIALRTRYFDDWLTEVAGEALHQVVLMAAGLDARAYRLAWPAATRVFEIDRPAVLAHKAQVLAHARPTCERRAVGADLLGDWFGALSGAGFDPSAPSAWLLEGLLFYLPVDAIVRILDGVSRSSAAGSRLGFDVINREVLVSPYTRAWLDMQAAAGAPWIGWLDDPAGFLRERGWDAHLTQAGQPEVNHGRWTLPVLPVAMPGVPHNWLVTAVKV